MALRNIVTDEDPFLKKKSREVTEITPRIRTLVEDMIETMHDADGVGIAAPQVGVLRRVAVVEVEDQYVLINPVITEMEGDQFNEEACLSVPGRAGKVHRPTRVVCECIDLDGKPQTYEVEGLTAVCFCHEIDHLNGILFIDKAEEIRSTEYDGEEEEEEE
ncbi:MAG: peptide deformylase [Firmicutes bacterium]|nr:peptide deformylase [Bacillota bacterium]MBR5982042.1 peptide deformylase [Bacillota bacterium]